jgi:hypothetical protein
MLLSVTVPAESFYVKPTQSRAQTTEAAMVVADKQRDGQTQKPRRHLEIRPFSIKCSQVWKAKYIASGPRALPVELEGFRA